MLSSLKSDNVVLIIRRIADTVHSKASFLSQLDAEVGDGDHGINLDRGFTEVGNRLPRYQDKDIGTILEETGTILISSVGGASGPLFGTLFRRAGKAVNGTSSISLNDIVTMFEAAETGVITLGGAKVGDKTMLDVLDPAAKASKKALDAGELDLVKAFGSIVSAAEVGLESTKSLVASKGRAMYLGERSHGKYDVGAFSLFIILKSVLETLRGIEGDQIHTDKRELENS